MAQTRILLYREIDFFLSGFFSHGITRSTPPGFLSHMDLSQHDPGYKLHPQGWERNDDWSATAGHQNRAPNVSETEAHQTRNPRPPSYCKNYFYCSSTSKSEFAQQYHKLLLFIFLQLVVEAWTLSLGMEIFVCAYQLFRALISNIIQYWYAVPTYCCNSQ